MSAYPINTFGGSLPQSTPVSMGGISNVGSVDAVSGSVLMYNSTNGKWEATRSSMNSDPVTTGTGVITLTVSDLFRGFIDRDTGAADVDAITPTAAAIVAALPGKPVGHTIQLYIRNTAATSNTLTLVGDTGVTVSGDADIGQNASALFMFRLENVTSGAEAVTAYCMGTFTYNT